MDKVFNRLKKTPSWPLSISLERAKKIVDESNGMMTVEYNRGTQMLFMDNLVRIEIPIANYSEKKQVNTTDDKLNELRKNSSEFKKFFPKELESSNVSNWFKQEAKSFTGFLIEINQGKNETSE